MNRIQRLAARMLKIPVNRYPMTTSTPNRADSVGSYLSARREITRTTRIQCQRIARQFERDDAVFNRFLDLCEQYIVGPNGLRIRPSTGSVSFNRAALVSWEEWSRRPDLGSRRSMAALESLICRTMMVDGEVFIHLTTEPGTARPRIQVITSDRVETPSRLLSQEGVSVFDGIEIDANGKPVKYHIKPVDAVWGLRDDQWFEVDAADMIHCFEPSRFDQFRGLPIIYPVLADMKDLQELQGLEMLAAKDAARKSKVVKTESGEVEEGGGIGASLLKDKIPATATEQERIDYYSRVFGAETVVLKNGDEYKQFESNRPSVAMQGFWDYLAAKNAAGMGVPIQVIMSASMSGASARGAYDMANAFFRMRAAALAEMIGEVYRFVIQREHDNGFIKRLPIDWQRFTFTPPRAINVDTGRNSAAILAEWRAGVRPLESLCDEFGWDWEEVLEKRALEVKKANELATKYGVTRQEIMQLDPNELSATRVAAANTPATQPTTGGTE